MNRETATVQVPGAPGLLGLLLATGLLYVWRLGSSGWANSFYSAAVQAGSESWKAFFFGSSDAAGSITVDKLRWRSGRWPCLCACSGCPRGHPGAAGTDGCGSVGLLYATVRRSTRSAGAGLLAGVVLALTPVAVLMFRSNDADSLLSLLLIGPVAATLREIEATKDREDGGIGHPLRWLALGGALVGLAFLTKLLQAFLVLPPLALVYLVAAQTPVLKRIGPLWSPSPRCWSPRMVGGDRLAVAGGQLPVRFARRGPPELSGRPVLRWSAPPPRRPSVHVRCPWP